MAQLAGDFQRANVRQTVQYGRILSVSEAIPLSKSFMLFGNVTATLLTNPGGMRSLAFRGVSGAGTLRFRPGDYVGRTFTTITVDDQIPIAVHAYEAGDGPYKLTTTGTLPTGLDTTTLYYVGVIDAGIISLHLTEAAAVAGTSAVAIADGTGTGTHTIGALPTGTVAATDGYGSFSTVNTSILWPPLIFAAPDKLTFDLSGAASIVSVWWIA